METRTQGGRTTKIFEHGMFAKLQVVQLSTMHTGSSKRLLVKEREAAPDDPVIMNPFR